jgi:hypothetical protein
MRFIDTRAQSLVTLKERAARMGESVLAGEPGRQSVGVAWDG